MLKFTITENDKRNIRKLYLIKEQSNEILDVYRAMMGGLIDYYGEKNVELKGDPAVIYVFKKPITWDGEHLMIGGKKVEVNRYKRMKIGDDMVVYPEPQYVFKLIPKNTPKNNKTTTPQNKFDSNYRDGTKLRASQDFWDNVKLDEGLPGSNGKPALNAYELGDGRVTIGWGHTGALSEPTPKVGDTITEEQAQKYLQNDAKESANCVRRILNGWKNSKLKSHLITQNMFDVLVSLSFNAGCTGLRTSKFIELVKDRKYNEAADILPKDTTMISGKFSKGLTARRQRESEKFKNKINELKNITEQQTKKDDPKKADIVTDDVQDFLNMLKDFNDEITQQEVDSYQFQKVVETFQIGLELLGYELPRFGIDGLFGPETGGQLDNFKQDNEIKVKKGKSIFTGEDSEKMYELLVNENIQSDEIKKYLDSRVSIDDYEQELQDKGMENLSDGQYMKYFFDEIFKKLDVTPTKEKYNFFTAWRQAEGGDAKFNPFNTTKNMDVNGVTNYNSVGVKNYPNGSTGIMATVNTLKLPYYDNLMSDLRDDSITTQKLASNNDLKTWGTGNLVTKVVNSGVLKPKRINRG